MAAVAAGDLEKVGDWIRAGGNPDVRDARDWTPLMLAAMSGFIDIARVLLAAGADVNARSFDGSSALLEAALWRQPQIVEFLLAHGADPNARADNGWTAGAVTEHRRQEAGGIEKDSAASKARNSEEGAPE